MAEKKRQTKISANKRTKSQRLANKVRTEEYGKIKEKIESRGLAITGPVEGPGWIESQVEKGYQRVANREAGSAVTKAEKAATARRRKRLADLKKRGVKPSNKFDLE
jgi:hypothetical protein